VTSSSCQLIPTNLGLLYAKGEGNSPISLNHTFWGYFTLLYVSQLSWGSPGFSADLEVACGCKSKEGSQFLCACRRANGVTWGLRHKVVHWLYVSIIMPSIPFASLVWGPSCQMASAKKRISRVKRHV
jgi:hypothetical protein